MLRVPGIAVYESPAFYGLCDELELLVWQDFMFANLDYPEQDDTFMAAVEPEARQILDELGGRPCLAVLCGGSEVAQQVAMMGLDPKLGERPLYGELLPSLIAGAGVDVPYVPSTPWGEELPFRPDRGVANYDGVGAYLRPLEDARRADVRFAGECLAFANVPDDSALAALGAGRGRDGAVLIDEASEALQLSPHSYLRRNVETLPAGSPTSASGSRTGRGPPFPDTPLPTMRSEWGPATRAGSRCHRRPARFPSRPPR